MYIEVNIRVLVCLLGCNIKFTGTLILISAVNGTGALATAFNKFHYLCNLYICGLCFAVQ